MGYGVLQGEHVFPTRVGVNRKTGNTAGFQQRLPHPRGGEPNTHMVSFAQQFVFPTRVGVNRRNISTGPCWIVFPTRVGVNQKSSSHPRWNRASSPPAWG